MLVCKDCGKEYEDYDEIDNWKEPHGEELCRCSKCGGEVVGQNIVNVVININL